MVPSNIGICGNAKTDMLAKEYLKINESNLKRHYTDFKEATNSYILNQWFLTWGARTLAGCEINFSGVRNLGFGNLVKNNKYINLNYNC